MRVGLTLSVNIDPYDGPYEESTTFHAHQTAYQFDDLDYVISLMMLNLKRKVLDNLKEISPVKVTNEEKPTRATGR